MTGNASQHLGELLHESFAIRQRLFGQSLQNLREWLDNPAGLREPYFGQVHALADAVEQTIELERRGLDLLAGMARQNPLAAQPLAITVTAGRQLLATRKRLWQPVFRQAEEFCALLPTSAPTPNPHAGAEARAIRRLAATAATAR